MHKVAIVMHPIILEMLVTTQETDNLYIKGIQWVNRDRLLKIEAVLTLNQ